MTFLSANLREDQVQFCQRGLAESEVKGGGIEFREDIQKYFTLTVQGDQAILYVLNSPRYEGSVSYVLLRATIDQAICLIYFLEQGCEHCQDCMVASRIEELAKSLAALITIRQAASRVFPSLQSIPLPFQPIDVSDHSKWRLIAGQLLQQTVEAQALLDREVKECTRPSLCES